MTIVGLGAFYRTLLTLSVGVTQVYFAVVQFATFAAFWQMMLRWTDCQKK